MAKSIMITEKGKCFICGRHCATEKHHVFEGSGRRNPSEKWGLWVYLCPWCHRLAKDSVHNDKDRSNALKAQVQIRAMVVHGWDKQDFREKFRKSYI